jgi:hypothetical protein
MALLFAKNNSLSAVTALPASISGGGLNLISTQTASSSATIDFTSNIDSTYDKYIFKFINCQPTTNIRNFEFQGSTDGGSNYNVTMTTTYFRAYHYEDNSSTALGYYTGGDQAQGTSYQNLANDMSSGSDDNLCGELILYAPSDTTFVKHFMSRTSGVNPDSTGLMVDTFVAGYFNTTSAINAMSFRYEAGSNMNGTIKLYGVT